MESRGAILITGNLGYIGPVVVQQLSESRPGVPLIGVDSGFFCHCLTTREPLPERLLHKQWYRDLRTLTSEQWQELLDGVDEIIHLAAISNDPMGRAFEHVTAAINHDVTMQLAQQAKRCGVQSFVFASSCSMYGASGESARSEQAPLNPLTAYARSKVASEQGLQRLADERFKVTALRFGTACGMSPRLRLDLVLNDFVAAARVLGKIQILSDGTPWRPLIAIADMALAMDWALDREQGEPFLAINVGLDHWNYQVKGLAEAVATVMPDVALEINQQAAPDRRSYRVDFSRYQQMAPDHQPRSQLQDVIIGLQQGLDAIEFADPTFRQGGFMRLNMLQQLQQQGMLDNQLFWASAHKSLQTMSA
uniref:Putative NAD dependent epimerase/dehydratase. Putative sugar nucleotide epimerase/dehydratase n=1 Tax=Magnetococcus massalia (strain MO-1) TaxID=451514 RepID=A0A1S7LJF0_MAGMO|nr:Putative NAD dependent epimerase/dehydratase. Putative sugar nucleotide epimerase/dehydratase [Candidatus Magnetococcus massalia]